MKPQLLGIIQATTTIRFALQSSIGGDAFSPSPSLAANRLMRKKAPGATVVLAAKFEALRDKGGARRRKIERDWVYIEDDGTEYKAKGRMETYVFLPEGGEIKGCAVFMHGFSQYTLAYRKTLTQVANDANIAIISPETGITSWIVLGELFRRPLELIRDRNRAQFVLQRALSQDTKQCIQMVMEGEDVFNELGIGQKVPMGVCGHSMGGGLSFPVAADFPHIDYVFAMAPVAGVPQFDPITKGIEKRSVSNSMLLAGSWDLLAKANEVEVISEKSNEKKKNSSIFVEIKRGLHTGFQDRLVLTRVPLDLILVSVFGLFSLLDYLVLAFAGFLRTNTGQLEGSELLMQYFFSSMVTSKRVDPDAADTYLQNNIENPNWYKNFNITYV